MYSVNYEKLIVFHLHYVFLHLLRGTDQRIINMNEQFDIQVSFYF